MTISAVPGVMSGEYTASPFDPMRTWLVTLPPRWAMPMVSAVRTCQPLL